MKVWAKPHRLQRGQLMIPILSTLELPTHCHSPTLPVRKVLDLLKSTFMLNIFFHVGNGSLNKLTASLHAKHFAAA